MHLTLALYSLTASVYPTDVDLQLTLISFQTFEEWLVKNHFRDLCRMYMYQRLREFIRNQILLLDDIHVATRIPL